MKQATYGGLTPEIDDDVVAVYGARRETEMENRQSYAEVLDAEAAHGPVRLLRPGEGVDALAGEEAGRGKLQSGRIWLVGEPGAGGRR